MRLQLADSLSYIVRTSGEVIACMPDDEEFSVEQVHDAVAGIPEPICFTGEGYIVFRERDAEANQLPLNELATSMWRKAEPDADECVRGRAFIAHPNHIPAFWRRFDH